MAENNTKPLHIDGLGEVSKQRARVDSFSFSMNGKDYSAVWGVGNQNRFVFLGSDYQEVQDPKPLVEAIRAAFEKGNYTVARPTARFAAQGMIPTKIDGDQFKKDLDASVPREAAAAPREAIKPALGTTISPGRM